MKKQLLSLIMVMALLITLIPIGSMPAYSSNPITRAEWIRELVELFDMTVEDESNMPDDYFYDFNITHQFYREVMMAAEFGVIDFAIDIDAVEGNFLFRPNDPVTRDFAARTLNFALGFQPTDGEQYPFEKYAYHIATERNWFALSSGQFMPQQNITEAEKNIMLADAAEVLSWTEINPNHINMFELELGVIEIPNGTDVSKDENGVLTIFDSQIARMINIGQTFVVYFDGLPFAYTAKSVTIYDWYYTIITTVSQDINDFIIAADAQGIIDIDLASIIPYDDTVIIFDDEAEGAAFSALTGRTSDEVRVGGLTLTSPRINGIQVRISDISILYRYEINPTRQSAFIGLAGNVKITGTLLEISLSETIRLGTIPTKLGPINLSLELSASGSLALTYTAGFETGWEYTVGSGLRRVRSFESKGFELSARVSASIGVRISWGIEEGIFKGNIYARAGLKVNIEYNLPFCEHWTIHSYLEIGAVLSLSLGGGWSFSASSSFPIIDKNNCPFFREFHRENGVVVPWCTQGNDCCTRPRPSNSRTRISNNQDNSVVMLQITDRLETRDTVNYHSFTLPIDGRVSIDFTQGNITHRLTLFDSEAREIMRSYGGSSYIGFLAAGTYYIRVAAQFLTANWNTNDYHLTVNVINEELDFNLTLTDKYIDKLEVSLEQDGNDITLSVSVLDGTNVDLSRYNLFIAHFIEGRVVYIASSVGIFEDGYMRYNVTLPFGDFKLLFWNNYMAPVFDIVTNIEF